MKILLISMNYAPEITGIGKYSGEMAEWLANAGHQMHVISAPPYYPDWCIQKEFSAIRYSYEFRNGVHVYRCPLWVPKGGVGIARVLHLFSFAFSSFWVIIYLLLTRKFDRIVVVTPSFFTAITSIFLSKIFKIKRAYLHVQDFEIDVALKFGLVKSKLSKKIIEKFESFILSQYYKVSAGSSAMIRHLLRKGVRSEKCIFFPNWVDLKEIFPVPKNAEYAKDLGVDGCSILVLYSGNMGEKQGLEQLINAASLLQGTGIGFLLCGAGSSRKRFMSLAKDVTNIFWADLQPKDKFNDLLGLADIHVLPQLEQVDGLLLPSKLNGMLASGKPIVATVRKDSQIAEIIRGCGFSVPPGDGRLLADAILMLANDESLRMNMGLGSRKYATSSLDIDSIMRSYEGEICRR